MDFSSYDSPGYVPDSNLIGAAGLGGSVFGIDGSPTQYPGTGTGLQWSGGETLSDANAPNSLLSALNTGLSTFDTLVKTATGAYASVVNTNNQAGQPERTSDGRYFANIQGRPTALVPQQQYSSVVLLAVAAVVALLLLRK